MGKRICSSKTQDRNPPPPLPPHLSSLQLRPPLPLVGSQHRCVCVCVCVCGVCVMCVCVYVCVVCVWCVCVWCVCVCVQRECA